MNALACVKMNESDDADSFPVGDSAVLRSRVMGQDTSAAVARLCG
jgi:hypothetical protein